MTTTLHDCAAYSIVAPKLVSSNHDVHTVARLDDRDVFGVAFKSPYSGEKLYRFYTIGTVISYAIRNGHDPIRALADAKNHDEPLFWANQNCVTITSHKQDKKTYPAIRIGELIRVEGRILRVESAPNDNIKLSIIV